ncbi:MAG: Periplasmic zinc-binding protein TroA [Chlamydiae bacterium]|nr:Periplasmic zinc-binding protein TroA [Chlamydiota bacterium]
MKTLWILSLTFFCCSCGGGGISDSYMEANGKTKVLSTTAMIDDLVGTIGGEEIDHVSLIQGNIDPHSYELVKGDGEKITRADVVFFNGLGLEHGASLKNQFEKHPNAIPLGNRVYAEKRDSFILVDGQIDPHIWMDIALFSELIDPIVQALERANPECSALFRERGGQLKEKMVAKDRELVRLMRSLPSEKRFLVTSHDAFHYFTRKYLAEPGELDWERRLIAPEGLAPDGQMGIMDIKEVTDFLFENKVEVVFPESNINRDALKKIVSICREKGLDVTIAEIPLYGDTMGGEGAGAESHMEMIEHNVQTLIRNLK